MRLRLQLVAGLVVLAAAVGAAPAAGAGAATDRYDTLELTVPGHVQPVRGSDGRQHLVYELRVRNVSAAFGVVITSVAVRDADTRRTVATLTGDRLLSSTSLGDGFTPGPTTTLGPSQGGVVYLAPTFASRRAVPRRIQHVVRVAPAPGADTAVFAQRYGAVVVGGERAVDRRLPIVLASPLRGDGLIAMNGCCASPGHTRTILTIGGRARSPERFAIDWMRADRQDRLSTGDGTDNRSYFVYGMPIHAVADGRIVTATDGQPDTPALERTVTTSTPDLAAGNHVIQTLRGGRFGMYAHIAPGTLRVKPGQRVRAGQVIGRVGSSGNSDAPHLHFQVTDAPSPLASDGLPYVFDRFGLEGGVVGETFHWLPRARERRAELPLDLALIRAG